MKAQPSFGVAAPTCTPRTARGAIGSLQRCGRQVIFPVVPQKTTMRAT